MEVISFRETDDEEDVRAKKVLLVEAVGTKPAKVASGQRVKKGELRQPGPELSISLHRFATQRRLPLRQSGGGGLLDNSRAPPRPVQWAIDVPEHR